MIPKAPKVAAPEKELRFTRSGQALGFWFAAMALVAVAVAIAVAGSGRLTEPDRLHPAWAALPLVAAWALARLAMRMTRHAYLILTPIGIEVFPFFRPADQMRVITWSEIDDAEADPRLRRLTLHFDAGKTSGIHLTLRPLREPLRPLLVEAVLGRVRGRPKKESVCF
jgi:hypothetical protein